MRRPLNVGRKRVKEIRNGYPRKEELTIFLFVSFHMNRSRTGGSASIQFRKTAVVEVVDGGDRRSHRPCLDDPAERS